jgi:hypothetical protein
MRTWMRLVAAILLILPFAPARLYAADPELTIKREDFQKLIDKVDKLQKDMTDNSLRGNRTAEDMRAIREELARIRELLERMALQQGVQRQAGYDPRSLPSGGAAAPTTGTIVLENTFSAPATVHINGRAITVAAYETLRVPNVPLGPFQYYVEVGGRMVDSPHSETLRPEGYRILIYTRTPF